MPADERPDELVDALLSVSRAMVGLAVRTLAEVDADVTLQQYRALVLLASFGPQPSAEVARRLDVAPSTVTRLCDRLVRRRLIERFQRTDDRRVVCLGLTGAGRELVGAIMTARRAAIADLVAAGGLNASRRSLRLLEGFAEAAGEVPDPQWWQNWRESASWR
jgi:DNA-binding MarR family transcriptional regulator